MKQNPLYLQILIMSHCVGHSDFFKNNRMFENTMPELTTSRFRNAKKRIQKYSENPNIGHRKVEKFIDAIHAIRFQIERNRIPRLSKDEIKLKIIEQYNRGKKRDKKIAHPDIKRRLLTPDKDLLAFLIEYGTHFEEWEIDILNIIRDESLYFIPQIQTKIINEGWASFWHYKIMNELNLPQKFHIPFLKSHNQVIRPHIGRINPYNLGFYIFNKVEKEYGIEECFLLREIHDDVSAVRMYLDEEDFRSLNLFSYSRKKDDKTIDDISDNTGWKNIREDLLKNIGDNGIPSVIVSDISSTGDLILQHVHDGRDLDLDYADNVVASIGKLWDKNVKFFTIIEEESWEI